MTVLDLSARTDVGVAHPECVIWSRFDDAYPVYVSPLFLRCSHCPCDVDSPGKLGHHLMLTAFLSKPEACKVQHATEGEPGKETTQQAWAPCPLCEEHEGGSMIGVWGWAVVSLSAPFLFLRNEIKTG